MNNTIQTNYTNKIYESSAAIQRQRSANEADASFSSLAARAFTESQQMTRPPRQIHSQVLPQRQKPLQKPKPFP